MAQAEICLNFFQDRKVTLNTGSSNYNTISVVVMQVSSDKSLIEVIWCTGGFLPVGALKHVWKPLKVIFQFLQVNNSSIHIPYLPLFAGEVNTQ